METSHTEQASSSMYEQQQRPLSNLLRVFTQENAVSHRPKYFNTLVSSLSPSFCPFTTGLYTFYLLDLTQMFPFFRIENGFLEALRHCCTPKEVAFQTKMINPFTKVGKTSQSQCIECGLFFSNSVVDALQANRRTAPLMIDPSKVDLEWIRKNCPFLGPNVIPASHEQVLAELPPPTTVTIGTHRIINPTFFFTYHEGCRTQGPSKPSSSLYKPRTAAAPSHGNIGRLTFGQDPSKTSFGRLASYCTLNTNDGRTNDSCWYASSFDPDNKNNWNRGDQKSVPLGAYSFFYFEQPMTNSSAATGNNTGINQHAKVDSYV